MRSGTGSATGPINTGNDELPADDDIATRLIKADTYDTNQSLTIINGGYCSNSTSSSCLPSPSVADCVLHVPIHIDENNVIEGAKKVLLIIRSTWDLKFVHFKKFTDGLTNKLVGCFFNPNCTIDTNKGNSLNENAVIWDNNGDCAHLSNTDDNNNVVLIRVYGNKTDLLIDREREIENIKLLHSYGFAPSLFATFKNGLAYEFVPGITLNGENVLQKELWTLVAKRMADMHRLVQFPSRDNAATPPVPMLLKKMERFFDLVPNHFRDPIKQKRLAETFLPIKRMRDEFAQLYKQLEKLNSPVVFSHNDLLLGNIIYNQCQQNITFIDYEYADYNYQAFDIGNHFAEYAGIETVDYSRYPNREFQLQWLRVYLQSYLQKTDITDAELQRLYVQVNQFALAAHFFWTIWSLVQAEYSTIDFDYVEYAYLRYKEYLARKDEFLAL